MECPFCVGADGSYTTLGHNMFFDIYKLSARIGNGGSPCGRPMNAPTGLCERLQCYVRA